MERSVHLFGFASDVMLHGNINSFVKVSSLKEYIYLSGKFLCKMIIKQHRVLIFAATNCGLLCKHERETV